MAPQGAYASITIPRLIKKTAGTPSGFCALAFLLTKADVLVLLVYMSKNIQSVKSIILPILKDEGVLRSSLFGSVVRGEDTPESDVDILIEFPQGKSLLDLVALERKLEEALGRDVDVVTYRSVHPRLKIYIEKDEVQIL